VEPVMIQSIEDTRGRVIYEARAAGEERILEEQTATIMQQMLKGVVDSGTAYALKGTYGLRGDWAGKTGTSQNYGDAWFIGFNPNLVAGVWVGMRYPAVHFTSNMGTGSKAALPIFGKMVQDMQRGDLRSVAWADFPKPSEAILAKLDCPFYRDERGLEKIEDFFKRIREKLFNGKDNNKNEKEKENGKKKPGFFKRLFGGGED
jgi:penicillin-binding protein 1A